MAALNKVMLIGHLGSDPETRNTSGGERVTNFRLATSEKWKDKSGEKQEQTEWHSVVLFKQEAAVAAEYLRKGSLVYIEGKIQTRKWQDKEGKDRYSTEIIGQRLQLMPSGSGAPAKPAGRQPGEDDEIPF